MVSLPDIPRRLISAWDTFWAASYPYSLCVLLFFGRAHRGSNAVPPSQGISQCLITTRIGFADIVYSRGTCVNGCVRHNVDLESTDKLKRGVRIDIEREVQVSWDGHDQAARFDSERST